MKGTRSTSRPPRASWRARTARGTLIVATLALATLLALALLLAARFGKASPVAVTVGGAESAGCVVLLHGLARSSGSMEKLAKRLAAAGYRTVNVDYPSRHFTIEELAAMALPAALDACASGAPRGAAATVHFVTHSLGGILVRQYLANATVPGLGRIVMLGPPNRGSEVVDAYRALPPYHWLNGPAGDQLGTGEDEPPRRLGPLAADVAVIAGTATINPILSQFLPNPDDGKVSVAGARLDGMCALLTREVSHPFLMRDEGVIEETVAYLDTGRFLADTAEYLECAREPTRR